MPKIQLKAKDHKVIEKINKVIEQTVIIQRQKKLTYGRWDFVVFGGGNKNETIVRRGFAEHAAIQRAPLYIASLSEPGMMDFTGVPIEEFITDDLPEEYQGLEVIQIDPVRPLRIEEKITHSTALSTAGDKICKEYENENIAVIQSPHESQWVIGVMKYLNECDRSFPDRVQESWRMRQAAGGENTLSIHSPNRSNFLN